MIMELENREGNVSVIALLESVHKSVGVMSQ